MQTLNQKQTAEIADLKERVESQKRHIFHCTCPWLSIYVYFITQTILIYPGKHNNNRQKTYSKAMWLRWQRFWEKKKHTLTLWRQPWPDCKRKTRKIEWFSKQQHTFYGYVNKYLSVVSPKGCAQVLTPLDGKALIYTCTRPKIDFILFKAKCFSHQNL